jgi:nitroalkane oxidase
VLSEAKAAELLATSEERFLATKPTYEAMVAAGYLRKCIPAPAGGDNAGLTDMAILAEEFYSVNASVTLTMLGTVLGLLPILLGGTPDQCRRLLAPFLKTSGAPLAAFCSSEPGGSANAASLHPVRASAPRRDGRVTTGSSTAARNGCPRLLVGTARAPMFFALCRTNPAAPPDAAISIIAVEGPVGLVFERAINSPSGTSLRRTTIYADRRVQASH